MTTTCTITKAGRCDTYGRPLLVGQRYTSSDDEIRSLWQAGFCSVTDAPTVFEPANYPYARQIAAIGVPFAIVPGDGATAGLLFSGTAGDFTLSAAIISNAWNVIKGCWLYMPANFGRTAYPAGWYWAVFTGDTAGTLYTNTYSTGTPERIYSPTDFPVNLAGRLTQTTSEVTGPTGFNLPGGAMGPNGALKMIVRGLGNTTANKTYKAYLGSSLISLIGPATTNPSFEVAIECQNQGSEAMQLCPRQAALTGVGASGAMVVAGESAAVDTAEDQTFSISMQISTTAACAILLRADASVTYGA